jgi:hypothetical protein
MFLLQRLPECRILLLRPGLDVFLHFLIWQSIIHMAETVFIINIGFLRAEFREDLRQSIWTLPDDCVTIIKQ